MGETGQDCLTVQRAAEIWTDLSHFTKFPQRLHN